MFYFCRRGQENMHNFCVQDLEIINSNGQKYFKKVTSELSKNHQGKTNEFEGTGGRMYATDAVQLCPVQSLEKNYLKDTLVRTDLSCILKKNLFR